MSRHFLESIETAEMRVFGKLFFLGIAAMPRALRRSLATLQESNTSQQSKKGCLYDVILAPLGGQTGGPIGLRLAASAAAICIVCAQAAAADDLMVTKAPPFPTLGLPTTTGTASTPAAIWASPGGSQTGRQAPASAAPTICFRRSIPSTRPAASWPVCKAATITCCQTVFSSAPKWMHRFRRFRRCRWA